MGLLDNQYSLGAVSPLLGTDTYQEMLRKKLLEQQTAQTPPPPMGMGGPPPSTGSLPFPSQQPTLPQNASLTDEQKTLLATNMFGTLGAKLLAAGQKITPAQRAQYLSQLGEAAPDPNKVSEMILRQQYANKSARENANALNLANLVKSPGFEKSTEGLNATQKMLFTEAMRNNDLNTAQKILDDAFTPKPTSTGGLVWANGDYYDPFTGTKSNLNNTKSPSDGLTTGEPKKVDLTKLGLPEGTEVSQDFGDMDPARQKLMADIYSGKQSLNQFGRNFNARLGMEGAIRGKFKDYNPVESEAAYSTYASKRDQKSPSSLYNLTQIFGTAVRHIASENGLLDQVDKFNNGDIRQVNQFVNGIRKEFGDPKINEFNALLHTLQGEVGKLVSNGRVTVYEQKELNDQLSTADSPAAMKAVLKSYLKLMDEKGAAIDEETKQNTGKLYNPDKMSVVLPKTKEYIERFKDRTSGTNTDKIREILKSKYKMTDEQIDAELGR